MSKSISNIYVCKFCGFKFNSKLERRIHLIQNHFEKLSNTFKSDNKELVKLYRIKKLKFKCDICGDEFETLISLRIHFSRIHEDQDFNEYCKERNIGKKMFKLRKNCEFIFL